MKFKPLKSIEKATIPPFAIIVLSQIAKIILRKYDIELTEDHIYEMVILLYGLSAGAINFLKHFRRK